MRRAGLGPRLAAVLCALAAVASAASVEVKVYRARHRAPAELLPLVEAALAGEGRVAVDPGTASLVLSGEPAALRRALALLADVDRPLRTVLIDYRVEEESALEAARIEVDWSAAAGGLRAGTLPLSATALRARFASVAAASEATFRGALRLQEGRPGLLVTGREQPIPGRRGPVAVAVAETGFEALPTVLGGGAVRLELRAFSGRVAPGGAVDYTGAATVVEVVPGRSAAVAVGDEAREAGSIGTGGASRERSSRRRVLLIGVELE